jgi:hypothetical protein
LITANVYNRVFFIRAEQYGTAFAIDHEGRQYLITAKHLLSNDQRSINFFLDRKWVELPVTLIGLAAGETDVAVFRCEMLLCPNGFPLPPTSKDIVIGQDVFFVGYPYKMWTDAGKALKGRPCPFVKKGTLSSAFVSDDGISRIYIDAINNEGFSGGPIVFQPPGKREFQVAGVVAKFKIAFEKVIDPEGDHTEMTVAYNTGFLVGFDISNAIEIISKRPNGLTLQA